MWWFYYHTRNFFRSFMRPIPGPVAKKWHRRLQFLYVFFACNCAAYTYYHYTHGSLKDRFLTDKEKFEHKARMYNVPQATVYQFKNGTLKSYEIDVTQDN